MDNIGRKVDLALQVTAKVCFDLGWGIPLGRNWNTRVEEGVTRVNVSIPSSTKIPRWDWHAMPSFTVLFYEKNGEPVLPGQGGNIQFHQPGNPTRWAIWKLDNGRVEVKLIEGEQEHLLTQIVHSGLVDLLS